MGQPTLNQVHQASGVGRKKKPLKTFAVALAELKKNKQRKLYVYRSIENAQELVDWAKSQGFEKTLQPEDMHVTIAYSKEAFDCSEIAPDERKLVIDVQKTNLKLLGDKDAVVLCLKSNHLQERHNFYKSVGASWDYESFQPHITLTYDKGKVDIEKLQSFSGKIIFGAEQWDDVVDDWADNLIEKDGRAGRDADGDGIYDEAESGSGQGMMAHGSVSEFFETDDSYFEEDAKTNINFVSDAYEKYSEDDKYMVIRYSNDAYFDLNKALREDSEERIKADLQDVKTTMDKLIADSSGLPEDQIVFRGARLKPKMLEEIKEGSVIKDKAFVSTSVNPRYARDFANRPLDGGEFKRTRPAIMRIRAEKGTKAITSSSDEKEIIFARGSSFRVVGVSESRGIKLFDMELISDK